MNKVQFMENETKVGFIECFELDIEDSVREMSTLANISQMRTLFLKFFSHYETIFY